MQATPNVCVCGEGEGEGAGEGGLSSQRPPDIHHLRDYVI